MKRPRDRPRWPDWQGEDWSGQRPTDWEDERPRRFRPLWAFVALAALLAVGWIDW